MVVVGLIPKPKWIDFDIALRIIGGQILYFFLYIYCMGITKRYAMDKFREENEAAQKEAEEENINQTLRESAQK